MSAQASHSRAPRSGKRKSSAKPPPKKARPKLALCFDCPFCGHEKTCDVKIDKDRSFAEIKCNICAASYTTNTHKLTQPVDVYAEWVDECDAVNKDGVVDDEDRLDAGLERGNDEEDDGYERERHDEPDEDWRQDDEDA